MTTATAGVIRHWHSPNDGIQWLLVKPQMHFIGQCDLHRFNPAAWLSKLPASLLPLFGATQLFVKTILHWSMDADLATEAPLCTYDEGRQILTTPRDAQQESILSDICSLPFFNRNTTIRVWAGTKTFCPIGFLHRNWYINESTTHNTNIPNMTSFPPLQQRKFFIWIHSSARATRTRGWLRVRSKQFNEIIKLTE